MKYRILTARAYTRKMKTQIFLRWFFYALVLLISYSLMSSGAFKTWQPYLIISLCVSVAMREQEFSSSIFGIFCGFMLDISTGMLFGFHALLLMMISLATALLTKNLIKANILNNVIAVAVSSLIIFGLYYAFRFAIWNIDGASKLIFKIYLPSFIATVVTAPLIYLLIKFISGKLGEKDTNDIQNVEQNNTDNSDGEE